jgi:antagonist of KipI
MVPGAIEIPPDGQPITLGPDGPTIGGYPLVGVMIRAEDEVLSRLGPGAVRHWQAITRAEAEDLHAEDQRQQARWIETVRQGLALRR